MHDLHPPQRLICATRLHELANEDAIISPLVPDWGTQAQAYRIDCQTGPYLMLHDECQRYRTKCRDSATKPRPTP